MSRSFGHTVRKAGTLAGGLLVALAMPDARAAMNADSQQLFKQGQRYERSSHTSQEYRRAYWAYCLAARHGHAEAAYNIAWLYLNGRGLPRDDELAGHWLDLAARLGDPQSIHLAERLLLDIADDDPNCPRSLGRKVLDVHQFNQRLHRFSDTGDTPFDLRPVSSPPPPDEKQRLARLDSEAPTSNTPLDQRQGPRQEVQPLPPVEDRSPPSRVQLKPNSTTTAAKKPVVTKPNRPSKPIAALAGKARIEPAMKPETPPKTKVAAPENSSPNIVADKKPARPVSASNAPSHQTQLAIPGCPWTLAARHDSYRKRVTQWLDKHGIHYQTKKGRDRVSDYFVVMIHPLSDPAAAHSTVSTLKTKGYRNFRVFDSGDYRNAVSLGIFRNQSGALSLVNKLKEQGFQAVHKRMNFPPIIPLVITTLSAEQTRALRAEFPPLPMKQLDCGGRNQVLTRNS